MSTFSYYDGNDKENNSKIRILVFILFIMNHAISSIKALISFEGPPEPSTEQLHAEYCWHPELSGGTQRHQHEGFVWSRYTAYTSAHDMYGLCSSPMATQYIHINLVDTVDFIKNSISETAQLCIRLFRRQFSATRRQYPTLMFICFYLHRFDRLLHHTVLWCDHCLFGHRGPRWQQSGPLHAAESPGHAPQHVQIRLWSSQESSPGNPHNSHHWEVLNSFSWYFIFFFLGIT